MTTGTCLCGAVRFEFTGAARWMVNCHCSMCRKHSGALYGTTLGVGRDQFTWLSGESDIVHYRASSAFERPFCRHCGSSVPDASSENVVIPAGTVQGEIASKPSAHLFVSSKSPMCDITDALKQFEAYPPGYGTSIESQREASTHSGSCLCDAVAFELDEAPTKLTNCHCTRCQRSRGTAYATNTFVRAENLRWVRGAEHIDTYKVPEAQVFSTSFCNRCGSVLPSLFAPIKRYIVPIGSLDKPLATKPALHIHVATRAPWFDITDALPQFEEMPPRERVKELMF